MKAHAASPTPWVPAKSDKVSGGLTIALLIGLLVILLAALAHRVTPEDLSLNPGDDEIPAIHLEGP